MTAVQQIPRRNIREEQLNRYDVRSSTPTAESLAALPLAKRRAMSQTHGSSGRDEYETQSPTLSNVPSARTETFEEFLLRGRTVSGTREDDEQGTFDLKNHHYIDYCYFFRIFIHYCRNEN